MIELLEVHEFVGSLAGLGASKELVVTTSTFSGPVAEFMRHLSQRVVLVDGRQPANLMVEHHRRVSRLPGAFVQTPGPGHLRGGRVRLNGWRLRNAPKAR